LASTIDFVLNLVGPARERIDLREHLHDRGNDREDSYGV